MSQKYQDDCLSIIFSFLPQQDKLKSVVLVDHYFCHVVCKPLSWPTLDISTADSKDPSGLILSESDMFRGSFRLLKSLTVDCFDFELKSDSLTLILTSAYKRLERLDLNFDWFDLSSVSFPKLRYLRIYNWYLGKMILSNSTIYENLTHLKIDGDIDSHSLQTIMKLPTLILLSVKAEFSDSNSFVSIDLKLIETKNEKIWPRLVGLDVSIRNYPSLIDKLKSFISSSDSLRLLRLHGRQWKDVKPKLPLEWFDFNCAESIDLNNLMQCASSLTSIACDELQDCSTLQEFKHLKNIETSKPLETIVKYLPCQQMESIKLWDFSMSLSGLYSDMTFDNLTRLELRLHKSVDKNFMHHEWRCPALEYLKFVVSASKPLDKHRPIVMMNGMKKLKYVWVSWPSKAIFNHAVDILSRQNGEILLSTSNFGKIARHYFDDCNMIEQLRSLNKLFVSYLSSNNDVELFRLFRQKGVPLYISILENAYDDDLNQMVLSESKERSESSDDKLKRIESRWRMTNEERKPFHWNPFEDNQYHWGKNMHINDVI